MTTTPVTVDHTATETPELAIPAPRAGRSYELFAEEVLDGWHGRHGCLDSTARR